MEAPVYRSLEARNTVLGLTFPVEFTVVLASWWVAQPLGPFPGLAVGGAVYVAIRALNYGRAEGFVQHGLQWAVRRALFRGRLSAVARVGARRAPRFPHGGHAYEGEDLAARLDALARRSRP